MLGPGQYVADRTEGITRVKDLPVPRILRRSCNYPHRRCPQCGQRASRRRTFTRRLHDWGDWQSGRPCELRLTYSQHHCPECGAYFPADQFQWAEPKSHYTRRVVELAIRLVVEDGLPYRAASWHLWRDHRVFVPFATLQKWVEAGGQRALAAIPTEYLDEVLAHFSGYVVVDELYDGPFCVLSLVDPGQERRLMYEVLDQKPTQADILRFFQAFQGQLAARGLRVQGITTDNSPLYATPIQQVFGPVPHQACQFHLIIDLTRAVLHAGAHLRKQLAAQLPTFPCGRPQAHQKKQRQRKQQQQAYLTELFTHRYLWVQHGLTPAEKKTVARLSRGQRALRLLRDIMDGVYRLFDRRCRRATALGKLTRLRRRVRHFKSFGRTLQSGLSAHLENAFWFLEDPHLPATSNAVERKNRRFRKMQKTVYRVRTKAHLKQRIALDMVRESRAKSRDQTIKTLHQARQK